MRQRTRSSILNRAVELVVPFAPGGGTDILARLLTGTGSHSRLGQTFVVLNRPGANTNLGTRPLVARAKPDGYTLLMTSFGLAANPSLYRNPGFFLIRRRTCRRSRFWPMRRPSWWCRRRCR